MPVQTTSTRKLCGECQDGMVRFLRGLLVGFPGEPTGSLYCDGYNRGRSGFVEELADKLEAGTVTLPGQVSPGGERLAAECAVAIRAIADRVEQGLVFASRITAFVDGERHVVTVTIPEAAWNVPLLQVSPGGDAPPARVNAGRPSTQPPKEKR